MTTAYHQHSHQPDQSHLRTVQDRMENFAGFGARKFAETQAREQDIRQQWEHYEEAQRRYDEEQAWYRSQQEQFQWQGEYPMHQYPEEGYGEQHDMIYPDHAEEQQGIGDWQSHGQHLHAEEGLESYREEHLDLYDVAAQVGNEAHYHDTTEFQHSAYHSSPAPYDEALYGEAHATYDDERSAAYDATTEPIHAHLPEGEDHWPETHEVDGHDQHYGEPPYSETLDAPYGSVNDSDAAWVEQEYDEPHGITRSDTFVSGTSSVHLAYDSSPPRNPGVLHEDVDSFYDASPRHRGNYNDSEEPSTPRPKINNLVPPRDTVYDDDFEEGSHTMVFRHTQYADIEIESEDRKTSPRRVPQQASATTRARKSLARDTIYIPDPKAKCASCGIDINFDELADHNCESRSLSALSSATGASAEAQSPVPSVEGTPRIGKSPSLSRARSPFFDKYLEVAAGKSTGAFATPMSRSASADARHSVANEPRPAIIRSNSGPDHLLTDEVEERRRRIEEQRQAKRALVDVSALPAAASDAAATTTGSPRPSEPITHDKSESISSLSSGRDSLLDSILSTPQTPGSTYDETVTTMDVKHGEQLFTALVPVIGAMERKMTDIKPKRHRLKGTGDQDTNTLDEQSESADNQAGLQRRDNLSTKVTKSKVKVAIDSMDKPAGEQVSNDTTESRLTLDGQSDIAADGSRDSESQDVVTLMHGLAMSAQGKEARVSPAQEAGFRDGRSLPGRNRSREGAKLSTIASRSRREERERRQARRCCVCDCSLASSRKPFVEQDGKLLCSKDYAKLYLPKCGKCRKSVEKNAVKSSDGALKGIFHRACFSCFDCDTSFDDGSFYVYENAPYCAEHYHERNGSQCAMCGEGIEGPCRQTEVGERYHPHCLRCEFEAPGEFCQEPLIEYFTINDQRLCERHADRVGRSLEAHGHTKIKKERRRTMLRNVG